LEVYTLYKCAKCGTLVDLKGYTEAKCPKCRYRILFKEIPPVKKDVTAR
jgi:DNA-directed RNA polymerase subunit P